MVKKNKQPIIISLGGSLISTPQGVDIVFLRAFQKVILRAVGKGRRFIIIVGGGTLCRSYNQVAKQMVKPSQEDLDWIGIMACRMNGYLLRVVLRRYAYSKLVMGLKEFPKKLYPVIVAEPWKPGRTSDGPSVEVAQYKGSRTIVNLTNIDYVYDKDPKKFHNAKQLTCLSWSEYQRLVGKWEPGGNYPFDPVASRIAQKAGISVAIMNGANLENFEKYLLGDEWKGTMIE